MRLFWGFFFTFVHLVVRLNSQTFKIVSVLQNDQETQVQTFEDTLTTIAKNTNITFSRIKLNDLTDEFHQICNGLANGVSLLLDFTWSGNEITQEIADNTSIPYIHVEVSIAPFLVLLDAYLDSRNSTDILLIFDKDDYIDQALYYWLDSMRLRMVMSETVDSATANRIKQIRPIPNTFAIVASTRNMNKLFLQVKNENLLTLPDRWNLLFTDFQSTSFPKIVLENQPFSLLYLKTELCLDLLEKDQCPTDFSIHDQFLYWLASAINKVALNMLSEKLEFPNESFDCNKTKFPDETKERFREISDYVINESNKLLVKIGNTVRVAVRGNVEKFYNGSFKTIAQYKDGSFVVEPGKTIDPIKPFYRIGITHALPWSYKIPDPKTGDYHWTGYCADFAKKLSEIMNFDFVFVEPETGTFGEKINGTWNGVVGDLARGDTDLAITAIIMTADREEVIDFVAPYYEQTGITIVMRKPVRKTSLFKFMTVLKLEVWLSIVAALVVTGFMIWFLDKYSPYSARNNKKAYPYPCREFTLKESFWFALTSFTPQGGGEAPKALSGRTLVAAYWLFVVLMLATFTANLAAFLTVERMQAPVQSLEQLARQSRINYTVVQDSETHKYFINMKNAEDTLYRMWKELTLNASTDDTRYRVWDYPIREQYGHILLAINDSNPVANASEGFRIVDEHLDADFAFIHDSSEIKYEISRNCNFTEVGEVFAEKPYAVAVQQGSHLQDDLSKVYCLIIVYSEFTYSPFGKSLPLRHSAGTSKLHINGLGVIDDVVAKLYLKRLYKNYFSRILDLQKDRFFEQLQAKYWNHSSKGDCPSTDDNEGITLESLGGVFIATLFGLALAMITLAGEVLYYRRKSKKEKEKAKQQIAKILPATMQNFKQPPKYESLNLESKFNVGKTITIGSTFKPVSKENWRRDLDNVNISHISLYPKARNRIPRVD